MKIPSCESRESRESRAGRDKDLVIHERRESRESRAGRDKDLEIYERRESRESSIEQLSKNLDRFWVWIFVFPNLVRKCLGEEVICFRSSRLLSWFHSSRNFRRSFFVLDPFSLWGLWSRS